jgi:hypothetical protein
VACYLCAYLRSELPNRSQPLPSGSPVLPGYGIGTCSTCSVWACSMHGTKYGYFVCAMCRPANAVTAAVSGDPLSDAEAVHMRSIGQRTSPAVRARVRELLNVLADHSRGAASEGVERSIAGMPNLILDYEGAVRARFGPEVSEATRAFEGDRRRAFEGFRPGPAPALDVIGAVIRRRFAGRPIEPAGDAELIVAGALISAMAVADTGAEVEELAEIEVRAPWTVSHPELLDPVMWLFATAFQIAEPTATA